MTTLLHDQPQPFSDGWSGILDPGAEILWQGRPDHGWVFRPAHIFQAIFGFFFAGFALFWMFAAASNGGVFWIFGLLHFGAGISVMAGGPVSNRYMRQRSWYTLTTRRAIISSETAWRGRRLDSYPITAATAISIVENGEFTDLFFASRTTNNGEGGLQSGPVGFERIGEGNSVLLLMRKIQSGTP
jgi:hypothetical protein